MNEYYNESKRIMISYDSEQYTMHVDSKSPENAKDKDKNKNNNKNAVVVKVKVKIKLKMNIIHQYHHHLHKIQMIHKIHHLTLNNLIQNQYQNPNPNL